MMFTFSLQRRFMTAGAILAKENEMPFRSSARKKDWLRWRANYRLLASRFRAAPYHGGDWQRRLVGDD
jgi:hypothetical protein